MKGRSNQLEETFGSLSKTLFFEFQTLEELARYFTEAYPEKLARLFDLRETMPPIAAAAPAPGLHQAQGLTIGSKSPLTPVTGVIKPHTDDIAVIGLSGRYPMAQTPEEFWEVLKAGKDGITSIPQDRWDNALFFDPDRDKKGKTYCNWGGFLTGVDHFDPLFFKISPRDAMLMDPQERLLLTCVWDLLERAGYSRQTIKQEHHSNVGVYVGAMYQNYHAFDSDLENEAAISLSSYGLMANRISHFFDLQGPCIAVDTMCSSSLVAIHMACESLLKSEACMAIAGGVNLCIHPKKYLGLSQGQVLGSHPNSTSFADGDGYLPSECVGAVLLKPLQKAVQDRDTILAIIKSTATNHSGHTHGFSVPNPVAQTRLIVENFKKSGIDPRTISYVESAANGSALGDPIEVNAAATAFKHFTPDKNFCAIGSVKSNIGHPEAASGMAQLTKVLLQMQHQTLVPSIKARPLNPNLDFTDTAFVLQEHLGPWEQPMLDILGKQTLFPRRATISSFGAGGSNAHLILEEYVREKKDTPAPESGPQVFLFSARTPDRLTRVVEQMQAFAMAHPQVSFQDFAYTLAMREAMEYRLAVVVNTIQELVAVLAQILKTAGKDTKPNPGHSPNAPVFRGNTLDPRESILNLLSPNAWEQALTSFMAENNLEKMAVNWTRGSVIPWKQRFHGTNARIIALPTYPFYQEKYWVPIPSTPGQAKQGPEIDPTPFPGDTRETIQAFIIRFLSHTLEISPADMDVNRNLMDYGVESVMMMKLARSFEKQFNTMMKARDMVSHNTIDALSRHMARKLTPQSREDILSEKARAEAVAGPAGPLANTEQTNTEQAKTKQADYQLLEQFRQGAVSMEEIKAMITTGKLVLDTDPILAKGEDR